MLSQYTITSAIALALSLSLSANAAPHAMTERATPDLSIVAQLKIADSSVERYKLLPKNDDFIFDFNNTALATTQNFPVLTGTSLSFSVAALPACSMNFVHLHPRATELFATTSGRIHSEMVPEGGILDADGNPRVIKADLTPGKMTIYPQGSFHTQVNPDCEAAGFAAAFNAEDAGFSTVANQTVSFSDDIVAATFGQTIAGEDLEKVRHALPGGLIIMVEDCLSKCGKEKRAL